MNVAQEILLLVAPLIRVVDLAEKSAASAWDWLQINGIASRAMSLLRVIENDSALRQELRDEAAFHAAYLRGILRDSHHRFEGLRDGRMPSEIKPEEPVEV